MTDEQILAVNAAIHTASAAAAAAGAGLAQIPGSDSVPISAIQATMVMAIAKAFDRSLTESAASAAAATVTTTMIGRGISQFLVGWIPGVGNIINATTAAGVTEALGWAIVEAFDNGTL